MKAASVAMLSFCVSAQAVGQTAPDIGRLGSSIRALIADHASSVVIMPDPQIGDRFWVAWTDDTSAKRVVRLAFLAREGVDVSTRWATESPDGYSPSLSAVPGWAFHQHPIIMSLYQIGAAFVHADLYGMAPNGLPRSLGNVEGALIETENRAGQGRLRVYEDALLRARPVCYVWNSLGNVLRELPCDD